MITRCKYNMAFREKEKCLWDRYYDRVYDVRERTSEFIEGKIIETLV